MHQAHLRNNRYKWMHLHINCLGGWVDKQHQALCNLLLLLRFWQFFGVFAAEPSENYVRGMTNFSWIPLQVWIGWLGRREGGLCALLTKINHFYLGVWADWKQLNYIPSFWVHIFLTQNAHIEVEILGLRGTKRQSTLAAVLQQLLLLHFAAAAPNAPPALQQLGLQLQNCTDWEIKIDHYHS